MAKLPEATVREIKARLARGERQIAVAGALGANYATVQRIASGRQWREVTA
ncbi:MAG: hypothetical protein IT201_12840 [Thermoleophilia bacterium]|nr:hypothetical protein [Thermoleophilia bacterium]